MDEMPPLTDMPADDAAPPMPMDDAAPDGDPDLEDATQIAGGDADLGAMLLELIDRRGAGGGGALPPPVM